MQEGETRLTAACLACGTARASKMRWGNASDTVPRPASLMSCRATQFMSPKYAVGPGSGRDEDAL